ncbi:MAG TPA: acetate/propionate family kinase [Candidatus Dormibacteraeota bacterium]
MRVLVLNAGSSSLKASVLETGDLSTLAQTEVSLGTDATRTQGLREPVRGALKALDDSVSMMSIDAVGHRIVHGGTRFRHAVRVTPGVMKGIESLAEFAPLHNHVGAGVIRAAQTVLRTRPQVATFDTAFHATLPEAAFVYPLPYGWYRDWKVRRFGFHGLSCEWSVQRAARLLNTPAAQLALIVAHLGSGASVSAILEGRSVDTSMGLTPLEGLMMGTRAGSVDPGILLYAMRRRRVTTRRLDDQLWHESGLVGVAGRKAGMQELEQAAGRGNGRAQLAVEIFVRRAAAGIAAMATALPRIDGLVFTGGIGEHSASVRSAIVRRLAPLGFNEIRVAHASEDLVLSEPGWRPAVLRVEAREDAVIAGQTAALLAK